MTKGKLSYYKIIGVETNANNEEINKAYKEKAKIYHPDKNGGSIVSNEMFKLITEAKECLLNPEERLQYDYSIGVKTKPEQMKINNNRPSANNKNNTISVGGLLGITAIALLAGYFWGNSGKK